MNDERKDEQIVQVDGWSDGPKKRLVSFQVVAHEWEENPHVKTGPHNPPEMRLMPRESLHAGTVEVKLDATMDDMVKAAERAAKKAKA